MHNIWLVLKHDAGVTLRQRSFWLITLLMPIALVALNGFVVVQRNELSTGTGSVGAPGLEGLSTIGVVDPAGLLSSPPPGFPTDAFVRFADEKAARAALEAGRVGQVVSIAADYVTSGQLEILDRNVQLLSSRSSSGFSSRNQLILEYLLNYALTQDADRAAALLDPAPSALATQYRLGPQSTASTENRALTEVVASVVPYAFYFLLIMGSSYLMRSVVAEKENRTAEVLMVSLDPRQLMVGKILAMSGILLVQLVIWVGTGLLVLGRFPQVRLSPGFVLWAALFLLLGYLLFASIMAAAGAVATSMREGNQVTWLLVIPLLPTLMLGKAFAQVPSPPFVVALSLFPLSAPSAMVTRLAVGHVPPWQILLSLALLAGTTYVMVLLAARFFRSGNLLSQEPFNWRRFVRGWGRAG